MFLVKFYIEISASSMKSKLEDTSVAWAAQPPQGRDSSKVLTIHVPGRTILASL